MDISKEIIGEIKANCETEKCCDNPGCDGTKLKATPHLEVINDGIQEGFGGGEFSGDESLNRLASGAIAIALELQREGHKLAGLATAVAIGAGVTSMEHSTSAMGRVARTFRKISRAFATEEKAKPDPVNPQTAAYAAGADMNPDMLRVVAIDPNDTEGSVNRAFDQIKEEIMKRHAAEGGPKTTH